MQVPASTLSHSTLRLIVANPETSIEHNGPTGSQAEAVLRSRYAYGDAEIEALRPARAAAPCNEIRVSLTSTGYVAIFIGPHAKEIGELFDTCTLPTPYTAAMPKAQVIAAIQAKNPGVVVS